MNEGLYKYCSYESAMRLVNRIVKILLLTSIIGLQYISISCMDRSLKARTEICTVNLPAGLDTMDFKAVVTFDHHKSYHLLKLPNGGTGTTVLIYDSTYLVQIENKKETKIKPLVTGSFKSSEEVLLDVSNLKSGKYYVHFISCNTGGIFQIKINNTAE